MFISKRLSRIFHKSGATVLLYDSPDMEDRPRIVMRNVETTWGRHEPTGKKAASVSHRFRTAAHTFLIRKF